MKWISIVLGFIFLLFAGFVRAQGCSVWVIPVSFGSYDTLVASAVDAKGHIYVTCDPDLSYQVILDQGMQSGGEFFPRKMILSGGEHAMSYNLYRDTACTEVWGDGTNNTYVRIGVGTGWEQQFVVNGRLAGGQNVPVGIYGDTVTVTIEW